MRRPAGRALELERLRRAYEALKVLPVALDVCEEGDVEALDSRVDGGDDSHLTVLAPTSRMIVETPEGQQGTGEEHEA